MTEVEIDRWGAGAIGPEAREWDRVRSAHQRAVDQHPLAVVTPESPEQVARVLEEARAAGVTVAPQAGGHGASEDLRGSVLLRTDRLDRVEVDTDAATAVVGAGVRGERLAKALAGTGLVAAVGTSPDVSPVPLLLGGGHSWISRVVGVAAQTIRRAEVVTGDGSFRWVDDASDPDLMRALRGAGGVLAVVTALEVDLVRASGLVGGELRFGAEAAADVWRAIRDAAAPDELTSFITSARFPDLPMLPEELRGRTMTLVHSLSLDGDLAALDPVRAAAHADGELGPLDAGDLASITRDPRDPAAGENRGWLLRELPDDAIDAVLDWRSGERGAAAVAVSGRPLGGALDRTGRPTVVDVHHAPWMIGAIAPIPPGDDGGRARAALDELGEVLAPWRTPGGFPTFLAPHQRLADVLDGDALALVRRLREETGGEVIRPTRL